MRKTLSRIKRLVERALHPLRRRIAQRRIRTMQPLTRIIAVCTGNVCRSPYLEHELRRKLDELEGEAVEVTSAGLLDNGDPSTEAAIAAARRRGVDLTGHRSTVLTRDRVQDAHLVLVMDGRHARAVRRRYGGSRSRVLFLGDLDPQPCRIRAIPDPINAPPDEFDACYTRIARCVDEFVNARAGVAAQPRTDVARHQSSRAATLG